MENDTPEGSESLTIDQAAAAYSASRSKEPEKANQDTAEAAESDDTTDEELQDGAEPESETEDGEAEDEGQAEETEEDEEPESDQGRFVASNGKVKLPDGTVSTVADLIQGNLRDRDYRQKTMESAEVKKTFETRSAALDASEKQIEQMRDYNIALIKSIIPPDPDPNKANPNHADYDPAGYQAESVARQQWAQHLQFLEGQQTQAQQERAKKATETEKETADREWTTLTEKLPHLKDSKRVDTFVADVRKAGEALGFTPPELKAVALDHRYAMALYKAGKWDALQASKDKVAMKVENRPPVQRAGKRASPGERRSSQIQDAIARAQSSGRTEDVAAAYHASRKRN